jgi:hypothetical protein
VQNDAAACHDVVLGARIQLGVQVGIASEEITHFCPQANETKKPEIQSTAVIEDTPVQELIRLILAIGKFRGLLVQGVASTNRAPRRKTRRGKEFQAQSRSELERCITLRHDRGCRGHTSVGNRDEFNFTVESSDLRIPETMAVANSKAAIRGNLCGTGKTLEIACLAGNARR